MKSQVALAWVMAVMGAASELLGGGSSLGSQQPAYAVLHMGGPQAEADAQLVELTLKNKLSARGTIRKLPDTDKQARLVLDKELNDLVHTDHEGGLFLYFRGVATNPKDGDFQLAATPEADDKNSLLLSELMQRLQKVRNPQAIWVLLDLETELTEQQIQDCLLRRKIPDPSVLVIAGVRTSAEEQRLKKSSLRLAHWISKGLSGDAGPPGGPRINAPASITQQGLVTHLRERLQPTEVFPLRPRLATSQDAVAEEPAATAPLVEAAAGGSVDQRPRSTEELVEEQAERWGTLLASQKIRLVYVSELTDETARGTKDSGFAHGLQRKLVHYLKRLAADRYDVLDSRQVNAAIATWRKTQVNQGMAAKLSSPELLQHVAEELQQDVRSLAILTGRVQPPGEFAHPAEFLLQLEAHTFAGTLPEPVSPAFGVVTPGEAIQVSMSSFVPILPADQSGNQSSGKPIPILPVQPPIPSPVRLADPNYIESLQDQIEEYKKWAGGQVHPLKCRTLGLSLGVRRLTKGVAEQLPVTFSDDEKTAWVSLHPGDLYTINIKNGQQRDLFLRLFVDGLSTLPEPERNSDGSYRLNAQQQKVWQTAAPVSPEIASYWFLKSGLAATVDGFYSDVRQGVDASAFRFRVVPAAESEAASQGLSEEAGYITALFYDMRQVAGEIDQSLGDQSLGSARGPKIIQKLQFYEGNLIPGQLVAVIQLQYRAAAN